MTKIEAFQTILAAATVGLVELTKEGGNEDITPKIEEAIEIGVRILAEASVLEAKLKQIKANQPLSTTHSDHFGPSLN